MDENMESPANTLPKNVNDEAEDDESSGDEEGGLDWTKL
jgi:hypothetical protein